MLHNFQATGRFYNSPPAKSPPAKRLKTLPTTSGASGSDVDDDTANWDTAADRPSPPADDGLGMLWDDWEPTVEDSWVANCIDPIDTFCS